MNRISAIRSASPPQLPLDPDAPSGSVVVPTDGTPPSNPGPMSCGFRPGSKADASMVTAVPSAPRMIGGDFRRRRHVEAFEPRKMIGQAPEPERDINGLSGRERRDKRIANCLGNLGRKLRRVMSLRIDRLENPGGELPRRGSRGPVVHEGAERVAGEAIPEAMHAARTTNFVAEIGRSRDVSGIAGQRADRECCQAIVRRVCEHGSHECPAAAADEGVTPAPGGRRLVLLAQVRGNMPELADLGADPIKFGLHAERSVAHPLEPIDPHVEDVERSLDVVPEQGELELDPRGPKFLVQGHGALPQAAGSAEQIELQPIRIRQGRQGIDT